MPPQQRRVRKNTVGKRKAMSNRQKRQQATVRERQRMRHLSKAFDQLRKVIPTYQSHVTCTKIQTLRLAIEYIHDLSELLRETNQQYYFTSQDVALTPSFSRRVVDYGPQWPDYHSQSSHVQCGLPNDYQWLGCSHGHSLPPSMRFVVPPHAPNFTDDDFPLHNQEQKQRPFQLHLADSDGPSRSTYLHSNALNLTPFSSVSTSNLSGCSSLAESLESPSSVNVKPILSGDDLEDSESRDGAIQQE